MIKVLVVGNGFIGSNLALLLKQNNIAVNLVSRRKRLSASNWIQLDATNSENFSKVIKKVEPDVVVLAHGPSDITWCERHPDHTMKIHRDIANNVIKFADNSFKILISTDNVFDGKKHSYCEKYKPNPINAYGRAKFNVEQIFAQSAKNFAILRASLVYGWEKIQIKSWTNFFTYCVSKMKKGEIVEAPTNHWNTPILISELVNIIYEFVKIRKEGVFHLSGPDRISRFNWSKIIAGEFGFNMDLVKPICVANTRFSCRPTNSCLNSLYLKQLPEFKSFSVSNIESGLKQLKRNIPDWY